MVLVSNTIQDIERRFGMLPGMRWTVAKRQIHVLRKHEWELSMKLHERIAFACLMVMSGQTPAHAETDAALALLRTIAAPAPAAKSVRRLGSTVRFGKDGSISKSVSNLGVVSKVKGDRSVGSVSFEDITLDGSTFLYRAYKWSDLIDRLTVRRVRATNNGAGFLLLRGPFSSVLIEDVYVDAERPNTETGKVPEGIALSGKTPTDTGNNTIIRRAYIKGIRSKFETNKFENGDAFAVERGYRNVVIEDSYGGWNSDAGFDIKSPTAHLDRVISEGNRRNFKFWANQSHGTLTSIDPGQPGSGASAHIQLLGSPGLVQTMRIDRLVAVSSNKTPVFVVEGGKWIIEVASCDFKVPTGTPILLGAGELKVGPGCSVR